jgi:hypothetical protein
MEKPWWLRLIGFLALVSAFLLGVVIVVSPGFLRKPWMPPVLVAWAIATAELAIAWGLISGIIWVINHSARVHASVTSEVLRDLSKELRLQAMTSQAEAEGNTWDNPSTGIACDECKRPRATLHCGKHNKTLCFPCTATHDTEECSYIAAGRYAQQSQKQAPPTRTTGSVLGI